MDKFMNFFEATFGPLMMKFASNRYMNILKNGMVVSIPILIVGSMILVGAEFPLKIYQDFMMNTFGDGWKWFSGAAVTASIGIAGLIANIGISSASAKSRQQDPVTAIVLSLSAYFILLVQLEGGGFNVADFGAKGLFTSIFVAFISTEIYCYVIEKGWVIKMPEGVPEGISKSFAALTPAFIIMPLFLLVRFIFMQTDYGSINTFILNVLQIPLIGIAATYGGLLLSVFAAHFLWFFGIHGNSVVSAITQPIYMATSLENLSAFQSGTKLPYIVTQNFLDNFQGAGGVGATLALSIMMIFLCKSEQMKTMGKLTVVPGIFGINEPMVFGLPLVLNPIIMIPFFIAPLVNVSIAYGFMRFGLASFTTGVMIPWTTPNLLSGVLATNDIMGGVIQLISLATTALIYYPFMRMLDNKYLREANENRMINEQEVNHELRLEEGR